eukprot:1066290-Prymnesium_polylepis.1
MDRDDPRIRKLTAQFTAQRHAQREDLENVELWAGVADGAGAGYSPPDSCRAGGRRREFASTRGDRYHRSECCKLRGRYEG